MRSMAYDEKLAARVREILRGRKKLTERKMFGGVGYMLGGNLCCGVLKDELIVRVGPDASEAALKEPNTRVFDLTGVAMKGWVVVKPAGLKAGLKGWVERGAAFAASLPVKAKG